MALLTLKDNAGTTKFEVSDTGAIATGGEPATAQAHVADPTGGATTDAEARTAIDAILVTLETFGFHATS